MYTIGYDGTHRVARGAAAVFCVALCGQSILQSASNEARVRYQAAQGTAVLVLAYTYHVLPYIHLYSHIMYCRTFICTLLMPPYFARAGAWAATNMDLGRNLI
jgi:hypothetical protein